jgi:histidinol-phosphate aminotransferase
VAAPQHPPATRFDGAVHIRRPSRAGYGRAVYALLAAVTDATRVVAIGNPGNPTDAHLTGDARRTLVDGLPEHVTVFIDEAYRPRA